MVTLNFTSYTRGKSFNNLVPYIPLDSFFYFVVFISSHNSIAMHFVLVELSRNSLLLIDDPSKKR